MRKNLFATTALALLVSVSAANATIFGGDTTNNYGGQGGKGGNAIQGQDQNQHQGQAQFQGQGQAQGQIMGQQQGVDNADSFNGSIKQNYESRPSAPGLAVAGGGLPSSSSPGVRNPCALVRGQETAGGLGAGIADGNVSGGVIAFQRGTSQGLKIMDCEVGEQQREMLHVAVTTKDAALAESAKKMSCLQVFSRKVLGEEYCSGLPVVGTPFGWTDDEEDKKPEDVLVYMSTPVTVAPQQVAAVTLPPAPAPQSPFSVSPTGKTFCTFGFDRSTGQCATS